MNDDLAQKIKQVADMLNSNDLPDNLKDIISVFANSSEDQGVGNSQKENTQSSSNDKRNNSTNELSENLEMLKTIKAVMSRLNTTNDPRINLLNALKPFLNDNRRKKVGDCIMFLQVTSLLETIKDLDKTT